MILTSTREASIRQFSSCFTKRSFQASCVIVTGGLVGSGRRAVTRILLAGDGLKVKSFREGKGGRERESESGYFFRYFFPRQGRAGGAGRIGLSSKPAGRRVIEERCRRGPLGKHCEARAQFMPGDA